MTLIFEHQMAERLKVTRYTMKHMRLTLRLPHIRVSEKVVLYDAEKIEQVLNKMEARV